MKSNIDSNEGPNYFGLSRKEAVVLSVFQSLDNLIDKGVISGHKRMTPNGTAMAKKLRDLGFEPTEEETKWAVDAIMSGDLEP